MEQDKRKKEWQTPILHEWETDSSNGIAGKTTAPNEDSPVGGPS
ncbi:hypothetical protein BBG19_0958 [Francisella sp. MA067296]|nr:MULTISPECIES: hypothetical protein [Francisella]APC91694.1 hypothetical protein BBG19_0958 [Francisella sp. MA067296]